MPRKPCFWTRKSELELVEFIKARPFIWKPVGNTNHQIQKKYKAYAEFAAKLGCGFTARSVRDRWVNIRSTFNHNVRRIEKSLSKLSSNSEVFVPCWPLWLPLQFLRNSSIPKNDDGVSQQSVENSTTLEVQQENESESVADSGSTHPQRNPNKTKLQTKGKKIQSQCKQVLNHLILSMTGLNETSIHQEQLHWFFGKHVTQTLNGMSSENANAAADCILSLLRNT